MTREPMRLGLVIQNQVINRLVRVLLTLGLAPPTYALLETTGRRSGRPRRLPVANGLQAETFWLISALGEQAEYVRNIKTDPRVRVKARPARLRDGVRMRWRSGTARLMLDDDPRERQRQLGRGRPGYRADGVLLRALAAIAGGSLLTVRSNSIRSPESPTHRLRGADGVAPTHSAWLASLAGSRSRLDAGQHLLGSGLD